MVQWGFLAVVFCPFSIFYNSGLLFNTSLVTFFFIISLYLAFKKRFKWATFALGLSFLYKQIILFFIIPILIFNVLKSIEDKTNKISVFIRIGIHGSILVGTFLVGSLPWILLLLDQYLKMLFMGQQVIFYPTFLSPSVTWPVNWYSFLIELKVPYWVLYIVGFLNFTMFGLLMVQLMNISLLVRWYLKDSLNWNKFLNLIIYNAFLNHLLLPRGVYKYYFTFHVPLVVLWICFNFVSLTTKQKQFLVIFFVISLLLLFIHRLFYLLIIWIVFFLMLKHDLSIKDMIEYDPRLFQE